MTTTAASNANLLPELRKDLILFDGPSTNSGIPTWNLYDPVRNRYFRIRWLAFQLLSRWPIGKVDSLLRSVNSETICQITKKDVEDLLVFLYVNGLTINTKTGGSHDYLEQAQLTKKHWMSWLIGNYLFLRIPLVRPDAFLKATLPLVELFFSNRFRNLVFFLGVIGFYTVVREWDVFINSFLYFFNFQGFLAYICALIFIKILHELGHGYTATLYGTKVSTMGIAFLVMFPILYTETSDAWRLKSRRQRLHIGMAGVIVELYIACIATFLWGFLPDGIFRSLVFILATTSLVVSLSTNLNFFMRFDGYYVLSDFWGIENLQQRAFNFGRWKLRKILFGLNTPLPEQLPQPTITKLIIYAWSIWLYRFFLFLGIAILVYYFFFKLLGIILFIIEILYFIAMPIFRELKTWWSMKQKILKSVRIYIFSLFLSAVIISGFIPWNVVIKIPAIFETTENIVIFPPLSSQVERVYAQQGQRVKAGELLATLTSPSLDKELNKTLKQIDNAALLVKRQAASPENMANVHVLLSQLEKFRSKYRGLKEQANLLKVRSPIAGTLVDMADNLHESRWISQDLPLFNITDYRQQHIVGMVKESDIARLQVGQTAVFYPDNPELNAVSATVTEIESTSIKNLKNPYLNSHYGGEVAVRVDNDGNYVPETGIYKVILKPHAGIPGQPIVHRGVVHTEGEAKNFFSRLIESITIVLIRESGF